jgi:hypothetical protein
MKIAQVASLMESVPPRLFGGTERVVSYLTDELVRLGHEVTLFASGDSVSCANLVRCVPTPLRLDANLLRSNSVLYADAFARARGRIRRSALSHRSVSFSAVSADRK